MHYKFTFTKMYRIGFPQLPREGVPQWNNSVKETSFKTLFIRRTRPALPDLRDEFESTSILLCQDTGFKNI